jgi:hypothetical protein
MSTTRTMQITVKKQPKIETATTRIYLVKEINYIIGFSILSSDILYLYFSTRSGFYSLISKSGERHISLTFLSWHIGCGLMRREE